MRVIAYVRKKIPQISQPIVIMETVFNAHLDKLVLNFMNDYNSDFTFINFLLMAISNIDHQIVVNNLKRY